MGKGRMVDWYQLWVCLVNLGAPEELVNRTLGELQPYFRIARSKNGYNLASYSEIDTNRMAQAISVATGLSVAGVVVYPSSISLSQIDIERWKRHIRVIDKALFDLLGDRYYGYLDDYFHECLWDALEKRLEEAYWGELAPVLEGCLRGILGYTLIGDEDSVERMRPLIRQFLKALPAGPLTQDRTTWVALVA